ncbi:helix-turn-helix domain-containing protein [Nocardioides sp. GXZ039]|uniref:helix-turn-helix domain-containing protein n=1 Tax=Nocardioides sp. GXZ039 TaxID=3136018 RepID=UPI0030F38856
MADLRRLSGAGSQARLSERLRERVGLELDTSAVARIETGRRGVSVDELLALALALDVSPLRLLLPPTRDDTPTPITPTTSVAAGTLWTFCEQLEPWWDDAADETDDPAGSRFEAWSRMRLGHEAVDDDRRESERVVDASGGYAAVSERLREIRGRAALFDVLEQIGVTLSSPAERRERRKTERRVERDRDRPLERQVQELAAQVARLTAALGADTSDDRRD